MTRRAARGFTLVEVLVALALVAIVLGGTLGLVREAIGSQGRLEERLLAEWAASNVLDQYLLEHPTLVSEKRQGSEPLLGHRFVFQLAVRALPPPPRRGLQSQDDAPEITPPPRFAVAVEVREGCARAPLARVEVERTARGGG